MRGRSCRLAALVSATAWWLAGPTGGEAAAAPGATQASTPNHRPAQPTARAQPANDDCGSATVIQDLSFSPQPVDTTEATSADDDPLPSCLVDGSGTNSNSVWYTHTPACDGFLTVETCDSDYDTVLTVYAGGCDELDEAACNDDACSLGSQISRLAVTEGVPLLVEVTQFGQAGGGLLEFHFDIECGQSPVANDSCADATVIDVVPYVSPTSDTTEATSEADDPLQSCGFDGPSRNASSVWYTYTPTCDGALQASTCGSDYDTLVTVYTGDCGELAEVGCNDDSCDLQSEIKGLGVDQGQVLLVEVTAYGSSSGGVLAFNLDVECYAPPEQPSDPYPADGAEEVVLDTALYWNGSEPPAPRSRPKVIYGDDDRLDEYQVTDPDVAELGDSTVMLVLLTDLDENPDGRFTLLGTTFGQWYELCPDEPFADQPAPGFCTGFLVAPDIIATAGHCITTPAECADTAIVFGFIMSDADTPAVTLDASEVYYCDEIVAREDAAADWGLLRLDRAVADHQPLTVRTAGKVPDGEPLLVIGHPGGLPRKYAAGANVRSNTAQYVFEANLDVYGGNSGSPVFSADTQLVEGVLVQGEEDFEYLERPDDCRVSNTCPDDGCSGENATRSTVFADLIPAIEYDVYFGQCDNLDFQATTRAQSWEPESLEAQTTYCWRIVARNDFGETEGPQWTLTTGEAGPPPDGTVQPVVEPASLDFGDSDTTLTVEVWNADQAAWQFEVTSPESWLTVSPDTGSSAGPSDRVTITVTVDRTGLEAGSYQGTITVGQAAVEVTLTVAQPPLATCQPSSLDFGTTETSLTFEAFNANTGLWEFDVVPRQSWIAVSPATGSSTGSADRTTITVTVDRTGLDRGAHSGTIDVGGAVVEVAATVAARGGGGGRAAGGGCGAIGIVCLTGCALGLGLLARSQRRHRGRHSHRAHL